MPHTAYTASLFKLHTQWHVCLHTYITAWLERHGNIARLPLRLL